LKSSSVPHLSHLRSFSHSHPACCISWLKPLIPHSSIRKPQDLVLLLSLPSFASHTPPLSLYLWGPFS
jgi:hypothetical protein